jgi:hypothetical protein
MSLLSSVQDGSQLRLSEADRKALVFGLALHEKGKASLEAGSVQVRLLQANSCARNCLATVVLQAYYCCQHTAVQAVLMCEQTAGPAY